SVRRSRAGRRRIAMAHSLCARQRCRPRIEQLEDRWLPSTLTFTAPTGSGPNNMLLRLNGNKVELLNNGAPVASESQGGLTSVVINGANGVNNTLTVDFSVGVFSVSGGIAFNNTPSVTDVDTLIVNGTTGADTISIGAASLTLDGSAISFSGLAGLQVNTLGGGDNVTVNGLDPTVATTVDAGTGAGPNAFNLNVAGAFSGNLTTLHFDHVSGT